MVTEPASAARSRVVRASAATSRSLETFRDAHRGAMLLVCGCGPSLRDLNQHEGAITIGVNDVGRLFDPTYLVVINPRAQFKNDRFQYVERSNAQALFTQLDLGAVKPPVVKFRLGKYGGVDTGGEVLHYTQNSPYVAVCLAAHMGARRIGLIGVDFTDDHFFARTGRHPLAGRLREIDAQYGRLATALKTRGIELVNLSAVSRLTSVPRMSATDFTDSQRAVNSEAPSSQASARLRIVSYATTPIAGVPELLARCISTETSHQANCLWATGDYGNGVKFEGGVQWNREPRRAMQLLEEADVVVVHNGKVAPQHRSLVQSKPVITMAHNYGWNVDGDFVKRGFPGVVVAQYQATLPEFASWRSVPNPLPLRDAQFRPEAKGDVVRICYTPSGAHESYPAGHRLYWHAKGFLSTTRVLDELARSRAVLVETTRGRQVSHHESLAMKRRAHIVIDECVTGSYHRNSLEGLAAGCVVVNGVGLVPAIVDAFRACSGPGAFDPFVFASLTDLRATLMRLIASGPEAIASQGANNRAWLEHHWDFETQWARFWNPAVEAALDRASSLRSGRKGTRAIAASAVKGAAMSTSIATSIASEPGVSVVIPHGGSERLPLLAATLAKLRQSPAVREIIIVDLARERFAEEVARRWNCRYLFVHHDGPFERARALNIGTAVAKCEAILWLDNDLLLPPSFVEAAANELNRRHLDFLLPFTTIRYMNADDSARILSGEQCPSDCRAVNILYSAREPSASGAVGLVRREFIIRFGGLIEGFRGWGGEDNAWRHKVSLLGRCGVTQRTDQHASHLYHPGSGGYPQARPSIANPHYRENVALMQQVCAIRDRRQFLGRFPPNLPQLPATGAPDDEKSCERTVSDQVPPPVWLYWEGKCPAWIRACHRTILRHVPTAKLLDAAAFDRLRTHDRDIGLAHLQPAHRADFVRAYLLAHYGGLWLDSDCIVMQSLAPLLRQLDAREFIAHRERSGLISNGFIAARQGSELARAYYGHVAAVLRNRKALGWTTLGSAALGAALTGAEDRWLELPCERIQPICWSKPESFAQRGADDAHELNFDEQALCYMLSNTQISQHKLGTQLLEPDSFFSFLVRRAAGSSGATTEYERIFASMGEQYRGFGDESLSGPGSTLVQTKVLRDRLPMLLEHLQVRTLLDAPCGDYNWMRTVDLGLERYIGVDILPDLIARNGQNYGSERCCFQLVNITSGNLPRADAILSRDFLVHLAFDEAFRCLAAFRKSGARYLLATTFPRRTSNSDTRDGAWRTLNLALPPFNFPPALCLIEEKCSEGGGAYGDKSLGVWRLEDLPLPTSG